MTSPREPTPLNKGFQVGCTILVILMLLTLGTAMLALIVGFWRWML